MTEKEFEVLCKERLQRAIENNDGLLAHFYGSMLLPSFVISPSPKYITIPWVN
jgi:hypothetical protein